MNNAWSFFKVGVVFNVDWKIKIASNVGSWFVQECSLKDSVKNLFLYQSEVKDGSH